MMDFGGAFVRKDDYLQNLEKNERIEVPSGIIAHLRDNPGPREGGGSLGGSLGVEKKSLQKSKI